VAYVILSINGKGLWKPVFSEKSAEVPLPLIDFRIALSWRGSDGKSPSAATTAAHTSVDGQTITNDCCACHQVLAAGEENPKVLTDLGMK
jgi:hypothetical protein